MLYSAGAQIPQCLSVPELNDTKPLERLMWEVLRSMGKSAFITLARFCDSVPLGAVFKNNKQ